MQDGMKNGNIVSLDAYRARKSGLRACAAPVAAQPLDEHENDDGCIVQLLVAPSQRRPDERELV